MTDHYGRREGLPNMDKIILTEESIKTAVSYAPISVKESFVDHCAMKCLQRVQVNLDTDMDTAMPNMYMEDTFVKSRYMMTALAVLYLGIPSKEIKTVEGDIWLMEPEAYDLWAMSHVLNQLERMKGKADLRDKVFDLLRDYRDLEKRLSTAIYSALNVMNDSANRLFQKIQMDTSNEALEEQKKNLENLMKEFEKMKEEKEAEEEFNGREGAIRI